MADYEIITDNHTLNVRSGVATEDQLKQIMIDAINELGIPCKFLINMPTYKDGTSRGYAFVWVSSMAVYNVLIGKNLDGSRRIEYKDDPLWIEPAIPLNDALEKEMSGCNNNWAEMGEIEHTIKMRYTPPQIETPMEPLIKVNGFKYTEDQIEILKETADEGEEIPEKGYIEIAPFRITLNFDNDIKRSCIKGWTPKWITKKMLQARFGPFVQDPITSVREKNNPKNIYKFPKITLNWKSEKKLNLVEIKFDPRNYDAMFALEMTKFSKFEHPITKEKILVKFFHPKNRQKRKYK